MLSGFFHQVEQQIHHFVHFPQLPGRQITDSVDKKSHTGQRRPPDYPASGGSDAQLYYPTVLLTPLAPDISPFDQTVYYTGHGTYMEVQLLAEPAHRNTGSKRDKPERAKLGAGDVVFSHELTVLTPADTLQKSNSVDDLTDNLMTVRLFHNHQANKVILCIQILSMQSNINTRRLKGKLFFCHRSRLRADHVIWDYQG